MLIDSHCHINYPEFEEDRGEVLDRARRVGVKKFILINTKITEAPALQKIAEEYEDVFYTIGNHPCDAYSAPDLHDQLEAVCGHPKLVGIGETGLDFYHDATKKKAQMESFEAHIHVANHHDIPVIVHTRDAEDETLAMIKYANKGVLHCFTGSYDMAKKALDLGFYISLSGILTFKNADKLRETAKKLPLDRILVETDAPYLTPEPHRKVKRNEPMYVYDTAKKLAELREMDFDTLCLETTKNCLELFSKITLS